METEDGRMIPEAATKRKRDEVAWGRGKMISDRRNVNILPQYLGGHETQQDSIQKIGMRYNKKMMNGKCQINGRGFHRRCFVADVWKNMNFERRLGHLLQTFIKKKKPVNYY